MSKTLTFSIILFLVFLFGFAFILNSREEPNRPLLKETVQQPTSTLTQTQTVDKRAVFAIYTNGTFRVFTASMYHNLSPDVYIEARNPNIVKVKKAGIIWNDFFKTLPFSLTKNCLTTGTKETFCTNNDGALKFYLNGVKDNDLLDKEIRNGDRALITYGNEGEIQIQKQLDTLKTLNNN